MLFLTVLDLHILPPIIDFVEGGTWLQVPEGNPTVFDVDLQL
jgi:hypothetical protein